MPQVINLPFFVTPSRIGAIIAPMTIPTTKPPIIQIRSKTLMCASSYPNEQNYLDQATIQVPRR